MRDAIAQADELTARRAPNLFGQTLDSEQWERQRNVP
jgi:hypothetical protein